MMSISDELAVHIDESQAVVASAFQSIAHAYERLKAAEAALRRYEQDVRALAASWSGYDQALVQQFLDEPQLLRPLGEGQYELIVPRFVGLRAGWLIRQTVTYDIFLVNRLTHLLTPLPAALATELGFTNPSFQAVLEDLVLRVTEGDPGAVYTKLGGKHHISKRIGNQLFLRPASRFEIIRRIIREGFIPFQPQPVPADLLRPAALATSDDGVKPALALRPYQESAYQQFLSVGAVCVLGKPQTGKTYLALRALAELTGPKLVLVPTRTLVEQWRARIALYLTPEAAREVIVSTYAGARKQFSIAWSLVVFDEAHHLPADFALEAATALTTITRIGLSATPWREDGQIDLLPALTGFPVGADWPVRQVQQPRVTVWLLKDVAAKVALAEQLAAEPVQGRTLIFVQRLEIGRELAQRLQLPFVSGETVNRQRVFQDHRMVIASSVGDEGISIGAQDDDLNERLVRVIEVDFWMGSRRQAAQRAGRLANQPAHATEPGQHHVLMTHDEYVRYGKRLLAYEEWGLDLDLKLDATASRGASLPPVHHARPRRQTPRVIPARPAITPSQPSHEQTAWSEVAKTPALSKLQAKAVALCHQAAASYVPRVFNACQEHAFTPEELAQGWGLMSPDSRKRIRQACKALTSVGLFREVSRGTYQANRQEIERLQGITQRVRAAQEHT